MKKNALKKIPLPNRRTSVSSKIIPSRSCSSQKSYSLSSDNTTLPKIDIYSMKDQLNIMNFSQIKMNRKLIKIETRLSGIERRMEFF